MKVRVAIGLNIDRGGVRPGMNVIILGVGGGRPCRATNKSANSLKRLTTSTLTSVESKEVRVEGVIHK